MSSSEQSPPADAPILLHSSPDDEKEDDDVTEPAVPGRVSQEQPSPSASGDGLGDGTNEKMPHTPAGESSFLVSADSVSATPARNSFISGEVVPAAAVSLSPLRLELQPSPPPPQHTPRVAWSTSGDDDALIVAEYSARSRPHSARAQPSLPPAAATLEDTGTTASAAAAGASAAAAPSVAHAWSPPLRRPVVRKCGNAKFSRSSSEHDTIVVADESGGVQRPGVGWGCAGLRAMPPSHGGSDLPAAPVRPASPSSVSRITSSNRRVPSWYGRSFSALPNDVLLHVCSMLRNSELLVLGSVDRRTRDMCSRDATWRLRCGFMALPETQLLSVQASLLAEPRLKQRWMRYVRWKLGRLEADYQAAAKAVAQRKRQCVFHCADSSFFCIFLLILLIVGADACTSRLGSLDDAGNLRSAGGKQLWPFATMVAFIFAVLCCCLCARADRRAGRFCPTTAYSTLPIDQPEGADEDEDAGGTLRWFGVTILRDNPFRICLVVVALLCLLVSAMLILLRSGGSAATEGMSWAAAFAPAFAAFGLMCFPAFMSTPQPQRLRSRCEDCFISWVLLLGPLACFVVLVCVRLSLGSSWLGGGVDSPSLTWMHVMSPLFAVDVMLLSVVIWGCVEDRALWGLLGYVGLVGPFVAWKVLLAYWMDHGGAGGSNIKLAHAMIPFWICLAWCGFGLLGVFLPSSCRTFHPSILFERTPPRIAFAI